MVLHFILYSITFETKQHYFILIKHMSQVNIRGLFFFFRRETGKGQKNNVHRINQQSTDSLVPWSLGYKHFLVFTNWKVRRIIISEVPKQNLSKRMILTHAFSNLLLKDNKDNTINVS